MEKDSKGVADIPIQPDDRPETMLGDRSEIRRVETLGRRVTRITILIPILIILIGYLGYRDIRDRVSQSRDLGSKELTAMAHNLESSFSNLSINHARLESETLARFDQLQTTITEWKEKVQKNESLLDAQKSLKADKAEVSAEISKLDTKVQAALKDHKSGMDKNTADVQALEKKLAEAMAKVSEQLNGITTALAECQADLGLISGEKADRKLLDITLKNQEKRMQEIADTLSRSVENQMEAIRTSLRELEKARGNLDKPPVSTPAKKPGQPG
jgi:chromosome segregation ATPase